MTYKLDGFKDKLEQVIDCVELENEKCDHSGTIDRLHLPWLYLTFSIWFVL